MDYPGSTLLSIAQHLLAGEIAYRSGRFDDAVPEFEDAVAAQETLPYTEPPFWYYPTRQSLGAALLGAGQPEDAEAVYRRDLEDHPHNGWALLALFKRLTLKVKPKRLKKPESILKPSGSSRTSRFPLPLSRHP